LYFSAIGLSDIISLFLEKGKSLFM